MKCPRCGADTKVYDTRPHLVIFVQRRHECFNGHRFVTYEVFAGNLQRQKLKATVNGLAIRMRAEKIRAAVRADENRRSNVVLGKALGISDARVSQIRAKQKRAANQSNSHGRGNS